MTREEFIAQYLQFLSEEHLQAKDIHVGAGGSLLMYGIRTETGDIDADAPEYIFNSLKRKYPERIKKIEGVTGGELLAYNEYIDLHHRRGNNKTEMIDGVCCETLEVTLAFKRKMNRPKDQEDIRKIEEYLKNKKPKHMSW